MSRTELARFIADTKGDSDLEREARMAGESTEGLIAFALARGYGVTLSDLPGEARGQRGNAIAGPGRDADRWGFWGSRNAPRPLTTDRL